MVSEKYRESSFIITEKEFTKKGYNYRDYFCD